MQRTNGKLYQRSEVDMVTHRKLPLLPDYTDKKYKHHFIPVFNHDFGVLVPQPDGTEIHVILLVEDREMDGDQMEEVFLPDEDVDPRRATLRLTNGTAITGTKIDLSDIVSWAIDHGYLEDPNFVATGHSEGI